MMLADGRDGRWASLRNVRGGSANSTWMRSRNSGLVVLAAPLSHSGKRASTGYLKGFSTTMPKYFWPAFKSSDQIRPQPARSAAAKTIPS